jgi:hypothetical protein
MTRRQIYLVPGFFGFARLGALTYFQGVEDVLGKALARRGLEAEIVSCRTQPTASIRRRADRLVGQVREAGGLDAEHVHFVGHSTGGLDVRLLTTPGVRLRPDESERRIVARTRSVVTVATPHFGTPLAGFFTTILGRQLLELLTVLATSWGGRAGLVAAAQAISLAARADDLLGRRRTFLDSLARSLLSQATPRQDADLWQYLREIASDQGAIVQLMPEAMHLYNAAVVAHPEIRYGALVTVAPPPPSGFGAGDLLSLGRAALAGAFSLLHTITAREHRHYPYPHPGARALEPYQDRFDFPLTPRSNDGIVPTFSQLYGTVLDVVLADHLDVVGQFPREEIPHGDWLPSGSGFDEQRFAAAWDRVAEAIAQAE